MEIIVNKTSQIIEVWLRNDEKALQEQLKPQFAAWRKQGFMPAVFLSGDKDLACQTSDLLCYNRKRIAELEVQQTKAAI